MDHNVHQTTLDSRRVPGHLVIVIDGELDILTTASLRVRFAETLLSTTESVIIDLSGVLFCDASGLALLVGAQNRAQADGRTVVLAGPREGVSKLLRITGLDRAFTIHPTVDDARHDAGRHPVLT